MLWFMPSPFPCAWHLPSASKQPDDQTFPGCFGNATSPSVVAFPERSGGTPGAVPGVPSSSGSAYATCTSAAGAVAFVVRLLAASAALSTAVLLWFTAAQ